jgi:hypothetical protein
MLYQVSLGYIGLGPVSLYLFRSFHVISGQYMLDQVRSVYVRLGGVISV